MLQFFRTKVGRTASAVLATFVLLLSMALPASAYSVSVNRKFQWDGYRTCYLMEYRTYHWYEDPFNNRDGWYPLYTVAARNCGR